MSEAVFTRIESERLILRRFEDSDLIPFVAYRNDPEVARYQSWVSCDEQEAKVLIREMGSARIGVPGEWFGFAIESNETGTLIGDCALRRLMCNSSRRRRSPDLMLHQTLSKGWCRDGSGLLLGFIVRARGRLAEALSLLPATENRSARPAHRLGGNHPGHPRPVASLPQREGLLAFRLLSPALLLPEAGSR